jgi:hypothetical protein
MREDAVTTNDADRTHDRVLEPDEAADEPEASRIEEGEAVGLAAGPEPAQDERELGRVGTADDDTVVDGDRSDTGPLLADATRYQDRWYEIQTGFVDEPRHAVQNAGELLTEMMDDLTRKLTNELGALDARGGAGDHVSTEDLRVTFQRYRAVFDRLLAA